MDFEEAYDVADAAVFGRKERHLTAAEVTVLRGTWNNQSYEEIAADSRYSLNYLKRDVGPKFWRMLSEALGEEVNKTNFRSALERKKILEGEAGTSLRESLYSDLGTAVNPESPHPANQIKAPEPMMDWGEAVDISTFHGRTEDLTTLETWILAEQCRLVGVLGTGGIGKTFLAVKLAYQIKNQFEYFIWRSLRHQPTVQSILTDLIQFLAGQNSPDIPTDTNAAITLLLSYFRQHRCLVVLDGAEMLLKPAIRGGRYLDGYEEYGELFDRIGLEVHKSCLVVTSREKPKEFTAQEGESLPVRSLELAGMDQAAAQAILKDKGLSASEQECAELNRRYSGSPVALKIAATAIQNLFDGNIAKFLAEATIVFDAIGRLLEKQFIRLSGSEKKVLYWLAIHQTWVSISELRQEIVSPLLQAKLLDALYALGRRSLIEKSSAGFTLQPALREYVIGVIVTQACEEIQSGKIDLLNSHVLMRAEAEDYLREAQFQHILTPLTERLLAEFKSLEQVKDRLMQIVAEQREKLSLKRGYIGSNVVNLLRAMGVHLNELDFSGLMLWQACFQGITLHQANFERADLEFCRFTETLGNVLAIAFSPDGQMLATGDDTAQICLWEVASGKKLATLTGHNSWIRAIAFSPNGQILASGSQDQTVRLWHVPTQQFIKVLKDPALQSDLSHKDWVGAVTFHPSGESLVSGSHDYTIKLWHLASETCRALPYQNRIRSIAFSPDGKTLAMGGDDCVVSLRNANTGKYLKTLEGHTDWVRSVAFSPNGDILASGSDDQTVRLWQVKTGECRQILEAHGNWVRSVAFSQDGNLLATAGDDYRVKLWNVQTGECLNTLEKHTGIVWAVTFSPDGRSLASGGDDQTVRVWQVESGLCLRTAQGCAAGVRAIAYAPEVFEHNGLQRHWLASGSNDHTVKIWDTHTEKVIRWFPGHTRRVWSVKFSPDGQWLASGSDDKTVRLWDVHTGDCQVLQGHTNYVRSTAFSPDGKLLASGGHDREVRLWEVHSGQCIQTLKGHQHWVRTIAFHPAGKLLASSGDELEVWLWDVETGKCVKTLGKHEHRIRSIAFSPDGKYLASGSDDKTILLWDVISGQCLSVLQGHTIGVQSVAFAPSLTNEAGDLILVSGSDDKTVRLWNARTAECLKVLLGHTHWVRSVAFHPDGQTLASGSQDETIRLWDVKTGDCISVLRTERPYEGMNITQAMGLSEVQKTTLKDLGAVEQV
ncbi:MAG: NACHT domain-containing protein [Scytolyngbya sp. HA4215-MV1]|jgi:WD40 repeat protein|nr:NACHT domain-containing protein [Scytolyngbya sp. HA4215-MV1]